MHSMASNDESVLGRQICCFHEWMDLQKQELSELHQARTLENQDSLSQLTAKCIQHFKDYMSQRSSSARHHVSTLFSPTWCSSLENSLLWIGGCRPTIFIRLIYAFCGFDSESELTEFLQEGNSRGSDSGSDQNQNPTIFGCLVGNQLKMVDDLHRRTIKEEERMSSRLASLQEEICDKPLAVISRQLASSSEVSPDSDRELDVHAKSMASILEEADKLRLSTLEEILVILTPEQGVDYLAASKKLRLCMHEWGMRRDQLHRRNDLGSD